MTFVIERSSLQQDILIVYWDLFSDHSWVIAVRIRISKMVFDDIDQLVASFLEVRSLGLAILVWTTALVATTEDLYWYSFIIIELLRNDQSTKDSC